MLDPVFVTWLVLSIIALAIYGLVTFIRTQFGPREPKETETSQTERELKDDVIASAFLLNHLYQQNKIGDQQYRRMRDFLDERFGNQYLLPQRLLKHLSEQTSSSTAVDELVVSGESSGEESPKTSDVTPQAPESRLPETESEIAKEVVDAEIVLGELIDHAMPPIQIQPDSVNEPADVTPTATNSEQVAATPTAEGKSQPAVPKRKMADVLAAFMQEKNIRWGELASGILIVGSAIGLVVSLRNELNDTIPYFPALLFMLITAAIHAAGSYTLKKWKLRNTSRGTLLIGLLLVPLNFLAACILTGSEQLRRPIDDPMYWIAVIIGVAGFSLMTWWSSRLLLSKGNLPLTIGMMGAAILTLVANR